MIVGVRAEPVQDGGCLERAMDGCQVNTAVLRYVKGRSLALAGCLCIHAWCSCDS